MEVIIFIDEKIQRDFLTKLDNSSDHPTQKQTKNEYSFQAIALPIRPPMQSSELTDISTYHFHGKLTSTASALFVASTNETNKCDISVLHSVQ